MSEREPQSWMERDLEREDHRSRRIGGEHYRRLAEECRVEGNAAVANGLWFKARNCFKVMDAYRRQSERTQEHAPLPPGTWLDLP